MQFSLEANKKSNAVPWPMHAEDRRKNDNWLARGQNNVSDCGDRLTVVRVVASMSYHIKIRLKYQTSTKQGLFD